MMFSDNFNMAIASIRASRLRSLLTMLGIIIGVTSVITSVSLAEGVKRQVSQETSKLGQSVVTVRPGEALSQNSGGLVGSISTLANSAQNSSTLGEQDVEAIKKVPNVESVVPMGVISGVPSDSKGKSLGRAVIISSGEGLPDLVQQKIEFGGFFSNQSSDQNAAVIGPKVAEKLYGEFAPLGSTIVVRDKKFVIRGVFEKFGSTVASQGIDLNYAVFIPAETAKQISGGQLQFYEILVKMNDPKKIDSTIDSINQKLSASRGGETDFSVLGANDNAEVSNNLVDVVATLVGTIAAISMLVGGVGIMNIMLVSVTERTQEIGIRKAIGASDHQIRTQFLIEAAVLSVWGAVIGVATAGVINLLIRIFTNMQPVIVWQTVLYATVASIAIGIIFGAAPAIKAAKKDPIDAFRS